MRNRQIHLDFHTSPYIDKICEDFDADKFAQQLAMANVESATVFAKCHHGMCYYPSTISPVHPGLPEGVDLLGNMMVALHKLDIKAPIYSSVGWEEHIANNQPQWRQITKTGYFANIENSADGKTKQPGQWKFLDFTNADYQDYYERHLIELLTKYKCDGFFIDILFFHPQGTWSESCIKLREHLNLMDDTLENFNLLEAYAQAEFAERFSNLIHSYQPEATVFFNTPNHRFVNAEEGVLRKSQFQTHFEIESLPSGFWGYYHFPRVARHLMHKGKPWFALTGKFQKMWGDFGGIKPQAALEFEAFRPQALGGGISIGDQLHPHGRLELDTYEAIGNVFRQVKNAESFYQGSEIFLEVGIVCPNYTYKKEEETGKSEEGVVMMLESLHYECAVVDDSTDLKPFKLIILPDEVVITDKLKANLEHYYKNGGKLLISGNSILDKNEAFALNFLPMEHHGKNHVFPTYWRLNGLLNKKNTSDRVVYSQGLNVLPKGVGTEVVIERVLPYFKRSDIKYYGHYQAPPNTIDIYPAALGNSKFIYFADPIFKEFREVGYQFIKEGISSAIQLLIGNPTVGGNLSPNILSVLRIKENDLIISLLYYIPIRKALDIDVIDESQSFHGQSLTFSNGFAGPLINFLTNEQINIDKDGRYQLPGTNGRLLLCAKNFFNNRLN